MAEPSEKKVLKGTLNGDSRDRLSALSDCVLLRILSLLDTKEAAATSVLSTRWRCLFLSLPDINLRFYVDDDASDHDRLFYEFVRFTNRVIEYRNNAPIRKIQLCVKHFVKSFHLAFRSLLMSVAAAISTYNVELLDIVAEMDKTTEQFLIPIPPGVFLSETLVSLSLSLNVGWNVPDFVSLPNLKYLNLHSFRLVEEGFIQRFLHSCSLLKRLVLIVLSFSYESEGEESIEVEAFLISNPLLKSLVLCCNEKVETQFSIVLKSENLKTLVCSLEGQHKLFVDASNLKSFNIHGHVLEVHVIQSLVSINDAVVRAEFLSNVMNVDDILVRAQHAFEITEIVREHSEVMPTFRNQIELELTPCYCNSFPRSRILQVLWDLFGSSPNLEVLSFSEVINNYFGEDEGFDSIFTLVLPLSFIEHLKVIEISNFKGEELEFKLVEYFLKNGKSLKKISLERDSWESVPKHCDRILSFKRCSKNCQIVLKKKWDFITFLQLRQVINLSPW